MPTVLCSGRGKLSFGSSLHRCLFSQVTRGQHSCAKDIWGDMTQSWPSQRALAGDRRILFNATDGEEPTTQRGQGRGDAQPPTNRHPRVAPHKSMLVDDLKLSSDEDDVQREGHSHCRFKPVNTATQESASWDRHSPSHTNGRRARNSSSDSSQSHSSVESVSGSLGSRSSSPAASPGDARSPRSSNKETDRPTAAQRQFDKWLKKSQKKAAPSDRFPTRSIPGNLPSPHTLRAPSPARCWDSNREYGPSRSPVASPQLSYRPGSPPLSPAYSFCPSPLPSTCPSPSNSGYSPGPSPVSSGFPSPCGSPRAERSPEPIQRDPRESPPPSPSQYRRYPDVQSHLYPAPPPRRTNVRSRIGPLSNSNAKTKHTNSTEPPLHQHRPTEGRDHRQNKSKAVLRPQSNSHPVTEKPAKRTSHYELIRGGRPGRSSDRETRHPLRHSSQHNTARTKHHLPTGRKTGVSRSSTAKVAGNNHLKPGPNPQPWAKASPVNASPFKTSHEKLQPKKREVVHRELPHTEGDGRKDKRKEGRKEEKRLAEEQLLRPRWIESSAEEEEGELVIVERRRRPREEQRTRESQTIHSKERPRHPDRARRHREVNRRDASSSLSPPRRRRSPSSSASSNSDWEYQVAKVPADSTSLRKRGRRGSGRPDAGKSRGTHSESPAEGQQSETGRKLYTLVPFGRSEQAAAPSQRGLRNLVVHIDLCLLKRVPDTAVNSTLRATNSSSSSTTKDQQAEAMKHLHMPDAVSQDSRRKRKLENGVAHKESKRNVPHTKDVAGRTESSSLAAERDFSTETVHNGYLEEYLDSKRPLSPLSPLSDSPEPSNLSSKAKNGEVDRRTKDKNRDSALKPKKEVDCVKVSRQPLSDSWGPAGHRAAVSNTETPHHAEYYLHEAKRMKHRADAMADKLGKAVNYVDAALSFMECGKAMERGPLEAKSPYTMYAETVELISFRCLALLYWQMFRLKKDHALKYSKVLLDYFKGKRRRLKRHGRLGEPCIANSLTSEPNVLVIRSRIMICPHGIPYRLLPKCLRCHPAGMTPGSRWTTSQVLQDLRLQSALITIVFGWCRDTGGPPPSVLTDASAPSLISIPQRIHQMAASHLNITNSVLYGYEYWEVADNLAKESKEFFNYLNTLSGPLTLHSSIAHAVQYTRQALQWIRISAKLN
ncbi:AF4/FMR2 family member 4 isoform X2 [Phyllopteryx taeniolatus]|uniref:AF4/FMR2 family member 4 isoform X2 n=1 Tax=Phyllopteryx taeniolatus TaxID=161469 RepID=UPI002AD504F4|nr:AF4/FMR2 family member 4 isoform X2 [Phyllopteryx taeniolatus]